MSAREVVDNNVLYCNTGLKYLSKKELLECCQEFFATARLADDALNYDRRLVAVLQSRIAIMLDKHPWRGLSRSQKLSGLFTSRLPEPPTDFGSKAVRA